jgi:hypothetical protein
MATAEGGEAGGGLAIAIDLLLDLVRLSATLRF